MNTNSLFFGIDPGASGAVACISYVGKVEVIRWEAGLHDVAEWVAARKNSLRGIAGDDAPATENTFGYLERVGAMPKQGLSSTFKFGKSYGHCEMLFAACGIPFERVTPVKWQNAMRCRTGGDKRISKAKAQELFPDIKITHKEADAILIAEYCRREYADF